MVAATLVLILVLGAGYYFLKKEKKVGPSEGTGPSKPPRATKQD